MGERRIVGKAATPCVADDASAVATVSRTDPTGTAVTAQAWVALAIGSLSTFLVIVDVSAVAIAFPEMEIELDVSKSALGWVLSGYSITLAGLLLLAGRLADSFGRRRVFLSGIAIFMGGSIVAGLAPLVPVLIAARVIQGAGGAVISGSAFAVVLPEFPPDRRSMALGFAGASGALGAVLGPLLGSVLVGAYSWRAIFIANVPICAVILLCGARLLRESRNPSATGRVDLPGAILGTAALTLLMFSLAQAEPWGPTNRVVLGSLVLGLGALPVLVTRSRTQRAPFIDLDLFVYRSFTAANVGNAFYGMALTSGFLVNSLVLQEIWRLPIRTSGLALALSPAVAAAVSVLSGRLADQWGHRWMIVVGAGLCAAGYGLSIALLGSEPQVWTRFAPLAVVIGIGTGLTVATYTSAALVKISNAKFGVALATVNSTRQAAYALGITAVLLVISAGGGDDIWSYRWAWMWVAVCNAVSAVVLFVAYPRRVEVTGWNGSNGGA